MQFTKIQLKNCITVDSIYTIHYFEYTNNFYFAGESHDFWEFIYVDKGSVDICMDDKQITLKKGDIAFHRPNEFHKVSTFGHTAPNLVVISFESHSPLMEFFCCQVLKTEQRERSLLADVLIEAKRLFESPLDDPYLTEMIRKDDAPIGTEQLIKIHLEQFLIHLVQRYTLEEESNLEYSPQNTTDIFKRVTAYMEDNIAKHLTIEQICWDNMIGRTKLQKIFHVETGIGIIDYFSKMKISAAKHMIRDGKLNFSQISEQLGYSSIHYFSRQFKKITGMSPSDYASSVKSIFDKKQ
ncbi:MAG: helix-turn-helix transcriptional regulator [Tyzzerella sp.]|nr:helix-turn-helix transcriptional regulator [Tyzzerella sp.]